MVEYFQRLLMHVCFAGLAALLAASVFRIAYGPFAALVAWMRRHPWFALLFSPCVALLVVYGSTKPTPVTPTVRGITLGSPMETPTSVSLTWNADEGREIKTNQLVRVYCRDAYNGWLNVAEGYGITNATVSGFFIGRDTDWMVEVEGDEEDDDE